MLSSILLGRVHVVPQWRTSTVLCCSFFTRLVATTCLPLRTSHWWGQTTHSRVTPTLPPEKGDPRRRSKGGWLCQRILPTCTLPPHSHSNPLFWCFAKGRRREGRSTLHSHEGWGGRSKKKIIYHTLPRPRFCHGTSPRSPNCNLRRVDGWLLPYLRRSVR